MYERILVPTDGSDVAEHAVGLGKSVGRGAATRRNELVHAAGSVVVATLSG